MAVDTRVLLRGLEDYNRVLEKQHSWLKIFYNDLDNHWHSFSRYYEGEAADQFRAGWLRTAQNFQDYLEQTGRIQKILEERIEALREVNKTEDGLIG